MTGIFVRICRAGKWCNIEIEHLTDQERADFFKDHPGEERSYLNAICKIVANIDQGRHEL